MFGENEQAQALREVAVLDPTFKLETFLKEAQTYMIPEILEAFHSGNERVLREWCSELVSL
jgi:import inner membrane translocase subunit TIM44